MMHILLESGGRARAERSTGWTLASITAHAALVTAAVLLTTRAMPERPEDPVYVPGVRYTALRPAPAPAQPAGPIAPLSAPIVHLPVQLPNVPTTVVFLDPSRFTFRGDSTATPSGSIPLSRYLGGIPTGGVHQSDAVNRIVVALPGNPTPDYPLALRSAGAEGDVLVRFVVDTLGRVEASSIEIVRASHAQFAEAVRRWLPRTRYAPAELGGRRVRQLVQQQVGFTLAR